MTVNSPTNRAPTVEFTRPAPSSTFTAPASITLAARASDTDGTIAKVDFYRGSTLLGSDTSRNSQNEYTYSWTNVAAGSYPMTARALDNDGAQTSDVVTITVSPVAGAPRPTRVAFTASANHATSVSSYTVAIYRGADNPVTASPSRRDPSASPLRWAATSRSTSPRSSIRCQPGPTRPSCARRVQEARPPARRHRRSRGSARLRAHGSRLRKDLREYFSRAFPEP